MRSGGDATRRERGEGELRARLRQWSAPPTPPEIEDDLRRTFRRRGPVPRHRGPMVWVSLAAALAVAAVLGWERMAPIPSTPSSGVSTTAASTPRAPDTPVAEESREPRVAEAPLAPPPAPPRVHRSSKPATAPATSRATGSESDEEAVVVEPGQAELLADLGRRLQGGVSPGAGGPIPAVGSMPEEADGTGIPAMPRTDLPAYRSRWETRAGEWPRVERPAGGR